MVARGTVIPALNRHAVSYGVNVEYHSFPRVSDSSRLPNSMKIPRYSKISCYLLKLSWMPADCSCLTLVISATLLAKDASSSMRRDGLTHET